MAGNLLTRSDSVAYKDPEYMKKYHAKNRARLLAERREKHKENPEPGRARAQAHRLRKYGLTLSEYEAKVVAQKNLCAVCFKQDQSGRNLAVDHDHATGAIRALLCGPCNMALGLFEDDTARLTSAIRYLIRHKER